MDGDDLLHTIKQVAAQQMMDWKPFVYAHIASYDPSTHRVKVVIPSLRDENDIPTVSPWMPLGTQSVGGFQVQIAPVTGATIDNPTAGEQVLVGLFDRVRGVSAVPCQFYTNAMQPPSTLLPTEKPIQAGEAVLRHSSGSLQRFHANGDVETITAGKTIVTATGDVDVATQGTANVTASTQANVVAPIINLGAAMQALHKLVTDAMVALFNGHTHPYGGGTTGTPNQTMGAGQTTSTVNAG